MDHGGIEEIPGDVLSLTSLRLTVGNTALAKTETIVPQHSSHASSHYFTLSHILPTRLHGPTRTNVTALWTFVLTAIGMRQPMFGSVLPA